MSRKVVVKDKNKVMDKYTKRQLSWCKRNYPAGTLIKFIKLSLEKGTGNYNSRVGIVVGYEKKELSSTLYLKVLSCKGIFFVAPNAAKSLQRLFLKPAIDNI